MNSLIPTHTRNLLKAAIYTAKRSDIKSIPYPKSKFKSNNELNNYLNNLTNFITHPELFYLNKKIHRIQFNKKTQIPEKYFSLIN